MARLENPDGNPCFGCGPRHARGLRLSFAEQAAPDGSRSVATSFTPRSDEVGWPTLFHHGLHFTVLYETSYWAALTLGGGLWVSIGPIAYTSDRLPRVGVPHRAVGVLLDRSGTSLRTRATSSTENGKPCGTLEATWRPARRDVIERAGIPLPDYLRSELME